MSINKPPHNSTVFNLSCKIFNSGFGKKATIATNKPIVVNQESILIELKIESYQKGAYSHDNTPPRTENIYLYYLHILTHCYA